MHFITGYAAIILLQQKYLEAAQRDEPAHWEFVKMLFKMTNEIERERAKKKSRYDMLLDDDEIAKFLDEEIGPTAGSSQIAR